MMLAVSGSYSKLIIEVTVAVDGIYNPFSLQSIIAIVS